MHNWHMPTTPELARHYLAAALRDAGADLATASRKIGRNHAYLQQYVQRGKPLWLKEPEREALVLAYSLDRELLKPPPRFSTSAAGAQSKDYPQIDAPGIRKLLDDPRTLRMLRIWAGVPDEQRDLALRVLQGFSTPGAIAA